MSQNIKCLTPQEEERFLDILKNRKDAERAYMLYHLIAYYWVKDFRGAKS